MYCSPEGGSPTWHRTREGAPCQSRQGAPSDDLPHCRCSHSPQSIAKTIPSRRELNSRTALLHPLRLLNSRSDPRHQQAGAVVHRTKTRTLADTLEVVAVAAQPTRACVEDLQDHALDACRLAGSCSRRKPDSRSSRLLRAHQVAQVTLDRPTFALPFVNSNFGIAMAARIPMITTTIAFDQCEAFAALVIRDLSADDGCQLE